MIIIECIKNVEKELEVVTLELERQCSKEDKDQESIDKLAKQKREMEDYVETYKKNLSELDDIEARIYYKMVYLGKKCMKAIEEVSQENYFANKKPTDAKYIHTKIYPKVKKKIKNLKKEDEKKINKLI